MADFPIYRLVKGTTLTFTEMDDNLRWLSRNMSGSTVTITGSAIDMSGSVSIIGDIQITGTASIGFIKSEGYSTGSNQLGDDTSDRQTLIGIVSVSGSMSVFGNSVITGSLAQGSKTIASGPYSHAEGSSSIAIGTGSHAEGLYTIASGAYQHVQGQYNATSSAQSAFIVGNGTDNNNRSNLIFAANNTVQITGSLNVLGSITGSLFGTASNAFSSSYTLSSSYAVSSSYAYTASSAISAYTASSAVSSSYAYTASSAVSAYTASSSVSSSYAITASHAESLKIGLNLSASNINVTNNIVANSITAQSASFGYVQTVTGSAVIIGEEFIILNTQTPAARYAGLVIYDSGSTSSTSSLVWDSLTNHFVYSNNSGSSYSGGGFIAGPRNSGSFADVTYPTLNRVLRGQGDDHIYDSNITDDNAKVSVSIPVSVTGSVTATTGFTGSLFGTASSAINSSYALTSSYSTNISGTTNYIPIFTGVNSISTSSIKYSSGGNFSSLEFPASTITGNIANYSDVSVFSNESANLYLYAGPVNNKMSTTLQNNYGTVSLLFQSGSFNTDLLYYEGSSTTNKTLTIGGYQGLVINQNGTSHFKSNLSITGSVRATQGFTGSLFGTSSWAISASWSPAQLNGTGFVKASGTTITYDNSTYYLASNPSSYIPLTALSAGTGINYSNTTGVITNTAPDQTVSLTNGTGISATGTYPNFTITNTAPDRTVALTQGGTTVITGTYPNFTITSNDQYSGTVTSVSGTGTVSGLTLTGTVSTTGNLTLGGTLSVLPSNFASQTANTVLAGPTTGVAATPSFRSLVAADIPALSYQAPLSGTGFVKISGTTISYDNSTYYLASNPNGYTTNTGTVTSVSGTGTVSGLTLTGTVSTSGNLTLGGTLSLTSLNVTTALGFTPYNATNPNSYIALTALSAGTGINYSNTTGVITNSAPDQTVSLTNGTGISVTGTYPNFTITNTAPNQTVSLTQGGTTVITGTYPNFTITSNDQYTGTVTGTGTTNVLPKWTSTTGIGNSILDDDGTSASVALASGGAFNVKYQSAIKLALTGRSTFGAIDVPVGLDFLIRPDSIEKLKLSSTGLLRLANYGSGSVTGTAAYNLAVDSSGNVIEVTGGGGIAGSGTTNFLSKFTGSTAIGNSVVYDDGTVVGIGTTNNGGDGGVAPRLAVANPSNADKFVAIGYDNTGDYGFIHSIHRATAWKNLALQAFGGNVGIGTTSPAYKLDVSGNIRALSGSIFATATGTEGSQYQLNAITIGYDSTNTIGWITAGGAAARTNLALQAGGGNVGIGTTTPTAKLEIYSGSGDNYIYTTNGTAATFNGLMVRYNSTNYMGAIGNPSTGEFRIGGFNVSGYYTTIYSNNSETVRVTGGNVGIGTTSPNSKLDVVSSGEIARLTTTSTTGNNYLTFASGSTGIGYVGYGSAGNNNLALINYKNEPVYLGSNSSVLVTVSGSGVGIGTTNPGYPLEISSTATLSIAYQRTGVSAKKWGFDSDNSNTYWYNITDDVRSFTLANGGNVGIGTTSPAYKLDVTGIGRFTGDSAEVLTLHKTSGGSSQIVMTTSFGNSFGISPFIAGVSNGGFSITDITNNVQRIVIQDSTGNVGIGTTSPSAKLDVSGNILANNFNSDNAVVNTADTYTGTAKITNIITLTQAEYNAIGSPSSNYLYVII